MHNFSKLILPKKYTAFIFIFYLLIKFYKQKKRTIMVLYRFLQIYEYYCAKVIIETINKIYQIFPEKVL